MFLLAVYLAIVITHISAHQAKRLLTRKIVRQQIIPPPIIKFQVTCAVKWSYTEWYAICMYFYKSYLCLFPSKYKFFVNLPYLEAILSDELHLILFARLNTMRNTHAVFFVRRVQISFPNFVPGTPSEKLK